MPKQSSSHTTFRAPSSKPPALRRGRISPEFLQPQIEVKSSPHVSMADARSELRELRHTVSTVAAEHGLAILAAGTHPTAMWRNAQQTAKKRYDMVMHDLQMIGQRDLLCGSAAAHGRAGVVPHARGV